MSYIFTAIVSSLATLFIANVAHHSGEPSWNAMGWMLVAVNVGIGVVAGLRWAHNNDQGFWQ